MASFQAKIGWERPRKRKIKVFFPLPSNGTGNRKFQKKKRKFKKIKKYDCSFISSQNRLKRVEKKRKQKMSFRFVPTQRVIENSQKIAKIFKKLKNLLWFLFKPK